MKPSQTLHQANLLKWTTRFKEQSDSGLTVKDWCSQNSISIHAFYYWKRAAKEAYVNSIMPEIVPISLGSPAPIIEERIQPDTSELCNSDNLHELLPISPKSISVAVDDIRIEIGSGASEDVISRLIKAVRYA